MCLLLQGASKALGWEGRCGRRKGLLVIVPLRYYLSLLGIWIWVWACTAAAAKSLQSCPTLCDPNDGRPPGSTVAGILQARTLEWVAISWQLFSLSWASAPVLRLFLFFLFCPAISRWRLSSQSQTKETKRELANAFTFFHHYLWAVGLWKLLVPNSLKEPFLLPSAFSLVHYIPASATLPIDTRPRCPLPHWWTPASSFLIRAHQWNLSVIRLFTYMFGLYISVLPAFPFFLVGMLGWFVFPWFLHAFLAITTPARESSLYPLNLSTHQLKAPGHCLIMTSIFLPHCDNYEMK